MPTPNKKPTKERLIRIVLSRIPKQCITQTVHINPHLGDELAEEIEYWRQQFTEARNLEAKALRDSDGHNTYRVKFWRLARICATRTLDHLHREKYKQELLTAYDPPLTPEIFERAYQREKAKQNTD